jgi:surface antigen
VARRSRGSDVQSGQAVVCWTFQEAEKVCRKYGGTGTVGPFGLLGDDEAGNRDRDVERAKGWV